MNPTETEPNPMPTTGPFLKRLADTISAEITNQGGDPNVVIETVGNIRLVRINVTKLAEKIEALYKDRVSELEDEISGLERELDDAGYAHRDAIDRMSDGD